MSNKPRTHKEILTILGGRRRPVEAMKFVADKLGRKTSTVTAWRQRNSIPGTAWEDVAALARTLSASYISLALLAATAPAPKPRHPMEWRRDL